MLSRSRKLVGSSSSSRSGSREQRGRERDAHAPAAGEFGAGARLIGRGEAKTGENFGGARRRRMRADVGEPRLDVGDAMRIVRGLGLRQQPEPLLVRPQHDRRGGCRDRRAPPATGGRCGSAARARSSRARSAISPAIARNRVDLPEPLRPTSPTRAPVGMCAEAWSISRRPATRTDNSSMTSMGRYLADERAGGKPPGAGNAGFAELPL